MSGWLEYQRWLNGPLWWLVLSRLVNLGKCRCPAVKGPHDHYRRIF